MLPTLPPSHRLAHFDDIDSTNAEAHRLAASGERGPLWIWADRQSRGRGRLGRSWVSEPGNLYTTFLFSVSAAPASASQISFAAALAVMDMVLNSASLFSSSRRKPGPNAPQADNLKHGAGGNMDPGFRQDDDEEVTLSLKWPNDVLLAGRKFSGILPEALVQSNGETVIALGCGINLATAPSDTPYPVTALASHGLNLGPAEGLQGLSAAMAMRLQQWDNGAGFAAIREAWLAHAIGLGGSVQTGDISGIFTDLGPDGALIITLPSGQTRHIHAGEVRFAALEELRARA